VKVIGLLVVGGILVIGAWLFAHILPILIYWFRKRKSEEEEIDFSGDFEISDTEEEKEKKRKKDKKHKK